MAQRPTPHQPGHRGHASLYIAPASPTRLLLALRCARLADPKWVAGQLPPRARGPAEKRGPRRAHRGEPGAPSDALRLARNAAFLGGMAERMWARTSRLQPGACLRVAFSTRQPAAQWQCAEVQIESGSEGDTWSLLWRDLRYVAVAAFANNVDLMSYMYHVTCTTKNTILR